MAKKRVFISFDYDHDRDIKTMLVGQAKGKVASFDFTDASVQEHLTGDWKAKVRERIRQADQVLVLCGKYTGNARGVAAEVKMAQELGKPYFLVAGRSSGGNRKPSTARWTDKMYSWTWKNIEDLVAGRR